MSNSPIIAVVVVIVVVLAGWFAYNQGYFMGSGDNKPGVQINLPNGSPSR